MATLKNPSIYDDRGTIGSADELDAYGVWVKIEPEELPDTGDGSFPDFDADFGPELSLDEAGEADDALGDFNYSDDGETNGFDDVEALRQDIQSAPGPDAANSAASGPAGVSADLSNQLLMKIADELSAIKAELSTLKGELSAIRSEQPQRAATAASVEEGGFFDEEDDGKIALTGDELNNIIHTADFTEETGDDAGISPTVAFATPDAPSPAAETEAEATALPAAPAETGGAGTETEIIYDGLGRPLTRGIAGDDDAEAFPDPEDSDGLNALRENGVEPMTPLPEDTSYLEEDPLAEETLDLSDAVIDEPDLSEGITDTPLEEPSLDKLSLIDLEDMKIGDETGGEDKDDIDEKLFLEDIAFEDDTPDMKNAPDAETLSPSSPISLDETESIDLSIFEDDIPVEDTGDLSFEVLDDDADLPVQEDVQSNVITDDTFESVSFDDEGIDEVTVDDDLEQSLPEGMKIELEDLPPFDLPSPETDEDLDEAGLDTENFELPGAANNADAGDQDALTTEVPTAIKLQLKDVLIYMDKLLESLPEEKIDEFAQSEHYATYKKLFDELGIQQ